jgi:DNA-binding GntR family transcriptional regulator
MARTDTRFRAAYNQMLDLLAGLPLGAALRPETQLSDSLRVSRTVVRAALRRMEEAGLIAIAGRIKTLVRAPLPGDRLPERDDYITLRELEGRFLDWVLRFDVPADTPLNVAQLAKQFSVPPHMLQEFLASLGQFGLVERRPRGGWRLLGFTADYAVELSEFRSLLEVNAVEAVITCPEEHPIWGRLAHLKQAHEGLMQRIETDFHDFSRLDEEFHASLSAVVRNRFVSDFQKVISLIFHYHYQWDKQLERHRNAAAIGEHLAIIKALQSRDKTAAVAATRAHLATSKETLLGSLRGNRLV